jgi:hypothetical protein
VAFYRGLREVGNFGVGNVVWVDHSVCDRAQAGAEYNPYAWRNGAERGMKKTGCFSNLIEVGHGESGVALPCILQWRGLCFCKEDCRRDAKPLAQLLDVRGVQLSFSGQHFGDNAFAAQLGGNVALLEPVLGEEEAEYIGW